MLELPTTRISRKSFRFACDQKVGSGCGAVGRAVAYDTRGPGFESSHRQLLFEHLFTVNCL